MKITDETIITKEFFESGCPDWKYVFEAYDALGLGGATFVVNKESGKRILSVGSEKGFGPWGKHIWTDARGLEQNSRTCTRVREP